MRKGIYGYPYLKYIIELWPGVWEDQLGDINEWVHDHNRHQRESGKTRVVRTFKK